MSAERQSPSAAYVPTQTNERVVIRSEERTSADLRNCSSGVSAGREPTATACLAILLDHTRKLMRRTLGQRPGRLAVKVGRTDWQSTQRHSRRCPDDRSALRRRHGPHVRRAAHRGDRRIRPPAVLTDLIRLPIQPMKEAGGLAGRTAGVRGRVRGPVRCAASPRCTPYGGSKGRQRSRRSASREANRRARVQRPEKALARAFAHITAACIGSATAIMAPSSGTLKTAGLQGKYRRGRGPCPLGAHMSSSAFFSRRKKYF